MQHDVKEAREAIAEVADNNAILAAVCLTEGATALDWSTTSHKPLHMSVSAAVYAVHDLVHAFTHVSLCCCARCGTCCACCAVCGCVVGACCAWFGACLCTCQSLLWCMLGMLCSVWLSICACCAVFDACLCTYQSLLLCMLCAVQSVHAMHGLVHGRCYGKQSTFRVPCSGPYD